MEGKGQIRSDKRPGQRLLPQVVDYLAIHHPQKVYASFAVSTEVSDGFVDVTMASLANATNKLAWWIQYKLDKDKRFNAICYTGISDIRYTIMILAAIKCGYKLLLFSPRNSQEQIISIFDRTSSSLIFHSEGMDTIIYGLSGSRCGLQCVQIPTLDDLLRHDRLEPYFPYNKSFDEAKNDPVLILHSSGSTGDPKLVTMTNAPFAAVDAARHVPVPEGRIAQNIHVFDFCNREGKFLVAFPPYHLAGVHSYLNLAIFSHCATLVIGPKGVPPNGATVSEIMRIQQLRALYLPPLVIEEWVAEPDAMRQAQQLDFILFGGGPLSPATGEKLASVTQLGQTFDSLELGGVQLLVPKRQNWSYLEFNPYEECDMQQTADGDYELVLHNRPELAWMRTWAYNIPTITTLRTRDLFKRHPTNPNLWQFSSRVDDLVVLGTGYLFNPTPAELTICGIPQIRSALIVGQGRPFPCLLVEPAREIHEISEQFVEQVWPTVQAANSSIPRHCQIIRPMVIVADKEKPFVRTPKGSVVRKATEAKFLFEVDHAYKHRNTPHPSSSIDLAKHVSVESIRARVRQVFRTSEATKQLDLKQDNSILTLGLDSLSIAEFCKEVEKGVREYSVEASRVITLSMLYRNPSVQRLSDAIFSAYVHPQGTDAAKGDMYESLESCIEEFTANMQQKLTTSTQSPDKNGISVMLLGFRGSLGPDIIHSLLRDRRVAKIHCAGRSPCTLEYLQSTLEDRRLAQVFDASRVAVHTVRLKDERLGLTEDIWDDLLSNVDVIIHNAWKVDYVLPFEYFRDGFIRSMRTLIDFCTSSSRNPQLVFCSSIASAQRWSSIHPGVMVPEAPFSPSESFDASAESGYGQSKHVAERILAKASDHCNIGTLILRLGQIAGPRSDEEAPWPLSEWIPSMIRISQEEKIVPSDLPALRWIPRPYVSRIICELSLNTSSYSSSLGVGGDGLRVFNIVNPKPSSSTLIEHVLREQSAEGVRATTFEDWVTTISRSVSPSSDLRDASDLNVKPMIACMLPVFQQLASSISDHGHAPVEFETEKACYLSPTMKTLKPISVNDIKLWLSQWDKAPM